MWWIWKYYWDFIMCSGFVYAFIRVNIKHEGLWDEKRQDTDIFQIISFLRAEKDWKLNPTKTHLYILFWVATLSFSPFPPYICPVKRNTFFFSCNRTVFPFLEKLLRTLVTHRFEMVAVTRFTNNDIIHKLQINLLLLQGPFMLTQDSKYGVCFEWEQPIASIPLVWPCSYEKKDYGPTFCWGTTALQVEIL